MNEDLGKNEIILPTQANEKTGFGLFGRMNACATFLPLILHSNLFIKLVSGINELTYLVGSDTHFTNRFFNTYFKLEFIKQKDIERSVMN